MAVDYSVYLVTDSTMVPEGSTFLNQISQAIDNGVTIIQLREKTLSTLDFIKRAEQVHELTKMRGIPLIINDRVDVALAIDAEGVHVGQDDMPATTVRKLLGEDKILGVTCSFPEDVAEVTKQGVANYVGLGTIYATTTKTDVKTPGGTGPIGVRKMLQILRKHNQDSEKKIDSVAIGGINPTNAANVIYQCSIPEQPIGGVAVVSCIMASEDPAAATRKLAEIVTTVPPWKKGVDDKVSVVQSYTTKVHSITAAKPLIHHITNNVVKNFSANVTLAVGASPAMSELPDEYEEFASVPNVALVANVGTPTPELLQVFISAFKAYNQKGKHIVYDPVAAGASKARLEASRLLLNAGHVSVIKGNVGEISAIYKLTSTFQTGKSDGPLMRGVDSVAEVQEEDIIKIGKEVSVDFRTVVVITGPVNYIIEEDRVEKVQGGHPLMGYITGTGCSLGSVIASFVASKADGNSSPSVNIFDAVHGALELYNISGKEAGEIAKAPGDFQVHFIDRLYENSHRKL